MTGWLEQAFPWLILALAALIWFIPAIRARLAGVKSMAPAELEKAVRDGGRKIVVLDVRTDDEFRRGHIKGAKHLPLHRLSDGIPLLGTMKRDDVVCVCASGKRSAVAAVWLRKAGFDSVYNLSGGMLRWGRRDVQKG
ncbi:MAG: rhodanese-like domain-containing protein [Nitrospirae bacterium]|nr:rhodanese-like domain-containing protein [Nitrospirota bacterium]